MLTYCDTLTHKKKKILNDLFRPQRQRLLRISKNQRDVEAGPGSRGGSTSNSLKRTASCSLENGGGRPGMVDTESGDKPGAEVCQQEEEDDDEDGIFSPVRIPGEECIC